MTLPHEPLHAFIAYHNPKRKLPLSVREFHGNSVKFLSHACKHPHFKSGSFILANGQLVIVRPRSAL